MKKVDTGLLEGRKMNSLPVWLGEVAYCWGRNAVGSPLPGDLRPGWLLVVLQSPEIPLTAYHSTKTTKISEKCSDRDITSETTSVCFLVVCGGALAHVCSKASLSECVCVCLCTSSLCHTRLRTITDFPQRSCALTGKVKGGGSFFSGCGKWRQVL